MAVLQYSSVAQVGYMMLSLGIGDATLTGLGITLAGPLAFKIRRATYLTRLPGLSLGLRSAGAWLMSR